MPACSRPSARESSMNLSDEVLLRCENLSCGYPGRTVLSGLNLELGKGTSTVLLGPNGSGKSTLLKSLVKTLPIQEGAVKFGTRRMEDLSYSDVAKQVAYVPQEEN